MSKELKALERIKNFMSKNATHWKQDISMVETALNRLEELEKILYDKLYYSTTCFNSSGKTYIDLIVEDDEPEFNLLREYLK